MTTCKSVKAVVEEGSGCVFCNLELPATVKDGERVHELHTDNVVPCLISIPVTISPRGK